METEFKMWQHYQVYPDGRIFDTKKNKWATKYKVGIGYHGIYHVEDGVRKNCLVHRMVASCWVDNPMNKPHVNHKDGNKQNNHMDNLEWIYPRENSIHYHESYETKYPTGVHVNQNGVIYTLIQIDGRNTNIGSFSTIEEAALAYRVAAKILIKMKADNIKPNGRKPKEKS